MSPGAKGLWESRSQVLRAELSFQAVLESKLESKARPGNQGAGRDKRRRSDGCELPDRPIHQGCLCGPV